MAGRSQTQAHTAHTVQSPGVETSALGTPVYMRTETTVPVQPAPVSPTSFEFWTPVLAFAIAIATIGALFSKHITSKFSEFEKALKPLHDATEKALHRLANEATVDRAKIQQLEQFRNADVERIVRLETNLSNIEKGQARIENTLEKNADEQKKSTFEIMAMLSDMRESKSR